MAFVSKIRKDVLAKNDLEKIHSFEEAIELVKKTSEENFDSTIRVSFNLNVDPRHADQMIRGTVILPGGTGKTKKVLAIVEDANIDECKKAKADFVGGENMINKIQQEKWFDFDVIVTTPSMMPKLSKLGKVLGPKGLMPNPKLGTITTKLEETIKNLKKGQIEYRVDKEGNINMLFGKKSFDNKALKENFDTLYSAIKVARPASVKGEYVKNIVISSTMGAGFKVAK